MAEWIPLAGLALFGGLAVAGYAVFGRDPSRLGGLGEGAARFYAASFSVFARGQVVLAGAVLAVELVRRAGWRWLGSFGLIYALSLGSELLGTARGIPFGPYAYTELLGAKWLGLVPVLIPLSWWYMAVPAYALSALVLGRPGPGAGVVAGSGAPTGGGARRVFLGSLLLLAWDLSLDPAMSEVVRYWVWGERGPYYGMPLMNLVGWYVTGLVLMAVLERARAREWLTAVAPGWWVAFYGANLLLPVGMTLAAGLWGAAVATALVLGGVASWAATRSRSAGAAWSPGAEVAG